MVQVRPVVSPAHRPVAEQIRRTRAAWMVATATSLLGMGATLALAGVSGREVSELTRDPSQILDAAWYTGLLSYAGLAAWAACAGIAIFGGLLLRRVDSEVPVARLLLGGGALSLVLLADDTLTIHEVVLPWYLGLPQPVTYALYGLLGLAFLGWNLRAVLETDYLLLAIAVGLLGTSVVADVLIPYGPVGVVFEDFVKFAGIVFWLAYFAHVAARRLGGITRGG
ncbi:MAG: hypothetical protein ACQEXJ_20505 [Myxococcota bacterium]